MANWKGKNVIEQFKSLIYISDDERKSLQNDVYNSTLLQCPDLPGSDSFEFEFKYNLMIKEGYRLFNLVSEKFGYKLWSNKAWRTKTCELKCPFGDICKKYIVKIDNNKLCYGQLYFKKINEDKLIYMTKYNSIKIIRPNGNIFIDLNSINYDKQILSDFFFEYEWFIWWFGDLRENNKINGYNVISCL
jgi:hypothetical protein